MFFCKHKLGEIKKDGYQYCKKCGKAFTIECNHVYEVIRHFTYLSGAEIFTLQCKKCGILKKHVSHHSVRDY